MSPSADELTDKGGKQSTGMTLEDKLMYLDKEIRLLHRFCVDSGYSPQHIERCAEPFLGPVKVAKRKKLRFHLFLMAAVVAVFAVSLHIDPTYRLMVSACRQASIKILPYWDWAALFDWQCLIGNPLYSDDLLEDDCKACEEIEVIQRTKGLDSIYFAKEHLKKDVPVIVEDGMKGWPEQNITVEKLTELYLNHKIFKDKSVCNVTSSIPIKKGDHRNLLKDIAEAGKFFAHWENCHPKSGKAFRAEFYKRPYFMPSMVEFYTKNWVFISRGEHKEFLDVPIHRQLLILVQLKGEIEVSVLPDVVCKEKCRPLSAILSEGQMLAITLSDVLYVVRYRPYGEGENIVLGMGGSFD